MWYIAYRHYETVKFRSQFGGDLSNRMADLEKPASSLDPLGLPKTDQESTSWEGETVILCGASSKNRLCLDFVHRLENG